jgi:hypothetical protein
MIQTASVAFPLEKGDHPEFDTSELCTQEHTMQYQSVIVALQWIVTIGWFDINTTIITMSGLHMASRVGHLNRLKYLLKIKHASIGVRTERLIIQTFLTIPMI